MACVWYEKIEESKGVGASVFVFIKWVEEIDFECVFKLYSWRYEEMELECVFFSFVKQFEGVELEHMFLLLHHDLKRSSWNVSRKQRSVSKNQRDWGVFENWRKLFGKCVCFWVECMFLFFAWQRLLRVEDHA
jgi:hypothetical protein